MATTPVSDRLSIALNGPDVIAQGKLMRVSRALAPPWVCNASLLLALKERPNCDPSLIALLQSYLSLRTC